MSLRLLGKIAVITGTGGGVGREAALLFAKEGAAIVGCDIDADAASHTVEMVKYEGGTMVSLHPRDLTDPSDCQALIDLALRTFGQIDVLFSSGAFATFNSIGDIGDEEWDRDRRQEIDLVFFLTRAAWPHVQASRGVLVNTASERDPEFQAAAVTCP